MEAAMRFPWFRRAGTAVIATVVIATPGSAAVAGAQGAQGGASGQAPRITVLSGRADLVTGGDALVEVSGTGGRAVKVTVAGRDVSDRFAARPGGRHVGLVDGLREGANVLTASVVGTRRAARLTLTNHPVGGPLFAGPQVQPWDCNLRSATTGLGAPVDAQCNTPAVFSFMYKPAGGGGFQPYDPAQPPADVATTTTDRGVTVPYVVRLETGVADRGIYRIAVLADPAKHDPAKPAAAVANWNGKVVWPFGGGSAPQHVTAMPPNVLDDTALSRGFLVASSGLHVHGANVNIPVAAEVLTMLQEHVIEAYGQIRYVIGVGCSGGSIMQHSIAEQYPGLLDGLLPVCSFPDAWTTATEVLDCGLMARYFFFFGASWTPEQQAAAMGTKDNTVCSTWNAAYVPTSLPDRAQNCGFAAGDPRVYNATTNPGGVRCVMQDYQVAIWGRRPASAWTAPEQAAGRGFAQVPGDNSGVLYGLAALRSGAITPQQFTDLNTGIGGLDLDAQWQPRRSVADPGAIDIAYRAGQVTQGHRLDEVPIIDLRGTANSRDVHTDYHSWELRARLDRANGHHAGQAIWTWQAGGNFAGLTPPPDLALRAFLTMDGWLTAIEGDQRPLPRAVKVRSHKPAAAADTCWPNATPTAAGDPVVDPDYKGACGQAFPYFGDARRAAGENLAGLALKCRLMPLERSALPELNDAQWAAVSAVFPDGVCDWSRRPPGIRPSATWLTFESGPGGRPLGNPPTSRPIGT
jgi:hypothetical protein